MVKALTLKGAGKKPRKAGRNPVINKRRTIQVMSQATQTKAEKDATDKAQAESVTNMKQSMLEHAQSLVSFKVLEPFAQCLISPEQLDEAINAGYPEIYIFNDGDFYQHMQFRGGNNRFLRVKVDGLPKKHKVLEETLKAMKQVVTTELNFLPAGKIPGEYWDQIVEFFRQVIKTKNAKMEAHAWILWSQERGYYISIPKQIVSAASVGYTWDAESVPSDSIVVVDVHSHNSMSAFYSGTDENDDKDKVYYTGVVGKITDDSYEWVMRFNLRDKKIKVTLDDLFELRKEVSVPAEWLEQVEVRTFTPPKGKGVAGYIGGPKNMTPGSTPQNPAKWTASDSMGTSGTGGAGRRPGENTFPDQSSLWDFGGSFGHMGFMGMDHDSFEVGANDSGKNAGNGGGNASSQGSREEVRELLAGAPTGNGMKDDDMFRLEQQADDWFRKHGLDPNTGESLEQVQQAKGEVVLADDDEPVGPRTPTAAHYDEVEREQGKDVAESYDLIDAILPELEGADKALIDIATSAYNLLSPRAQAQLQTNGFH